MDSHSDDNSAEMCCSEKKKLLSPEAGILTPDAHRLEGNSMSKNKRKVKDVDTS